jgi:hypothetical protein
MQYFKTDWSFPPIVQTQTAPRARSYRRTVRYGHARLGRSAEGAPAPAPVLIALPRVQAVVDAMIESQANICQAA